MTDPFKDVHPIPGKGRILSIDVLRGFAVLGILVMNIQSFSMIEAAYLNPSAYGDLTGINKWVWIISHMLADMKFLSIFSMLFGAGILMFSGHLEGQGKKTASLHYRRILWLLFFGLIHSYLMWHGDILVTYAVLGLVLYLMRKKKPKTLLIAGSVFLAVPMLLYLFTHVSIPYMPPESISGIMGSWMPDSDAAARELAAYRGTYLSHLPLRVESSLMFQTFIFFYLMGWRAGGMMLIGMALFKWGVLSAERSNRFYRNGMLLGFVPGLSLIAAGILYNFSSGWALEKSMFLGSQFNYAGSIGVAFGYVCLINRMSRSVLYQGLKSRLAAVGRMAFTNYLAQTILCTLIFYGYGLGLFGSVQRWGQILLVLAVWAMQLVLSPLWLRFFRFGPVEWLWRSLTYWKIQPMGKTRPS